MAVELPFVKQEIKAAKRGSFGSALLDPLKIPPHKGSLIKTRGPYNKATTYLQNPPKHFEKPQFYLIISTNPNKLRLNKPASITCLNTSKTFN